MKKISIIYLCLALCLLLAACGKGGQGTYYPDCSEMQKNLESCGYQVSVDDSNDGNVNTCLKAEKGSEYLVFYWLNEDGDADGIAKTLEKEYPDCNKLVSLQNDDKFGSLVFCGTEDAVNASGIVIVDVKVK